MVTVLTVFMYVNHLHMVLLSRPRDFYHTCYCLSGLSVCQHHPTGGNDTNSDDEDSVILVNAISVNKLCDCSYHIVSPCTPCSMYMCHCHYCIIMFTVTTALCHSVCLCVCLYVHMCTCVCTCVHVCVFVCLYVRACVCALIISY